MTERQRRGRLTLGAAVVLLVVGACSGSGSVPTASSDGRPSASVSGALATPDSTSAASLVLEQAWAKAELVDVATGDSFRIADHAGKVIVIETMAIWCPSCRSQQNDVHAALERLPAGSVEYVVLDVDPSEQADSLASYREENQYTGTYAVAGTEVARALAAEFGDQFLNPPSTPIVIIGTDGTDGTVTLTDFGHKSADDIIALAQANGA